MGSNMREIISGVYKITNKINEHSYIGSSIDIYKRWITHKWYLNRNKSHGEGGPTVSSDRPVHAAQ